MSDAKSNKMTKWIGFIILTLAAGLIYRVPYLKTVFYDNMVSDFGLTNTQIGLLMTVYSLTKTILYIPGGGFWQINLTTGKCYLVPPACWQF